MKCFRLIKNPEWYTEFEIGPSFTTIELAESHQSALGAEDWDIEAFELLDSIPVENTYYTLQVVVDSDGNVESRVLNKHKAWDYQSMPVGVAHVSVGSTKAYIYGYGATEEEADLTIANNQLKAVERLNRTMHQLNQAKRKW